MLKYRVIDEDTVEIRDSANYRLFTINPKDFVDIIDSNDDLYSESYTKMIRDIIETVIVYMIPKIERGDLNVDCDCDTKRK